MEKSLPKMLVFICLLFCQVIQAQEMKETETKINFNGFIRLRMTQENNFNSWYGNFSDKSDNFLDARSYLSMSVTHGPVMGFISLDVAGNDFTDGVEWGYPIYTPGVDEGPGFQNKWDINVRHLYVQYKGPFIAQIGRIPAGIGHNIIAHVNRDALRLIFPIQKQKLILVAIKGANDRLTLPESITTRANDDGAGDLNAFVGIFAYDFPSLLNSKGQVFAAKQQNTRENPFLPQYPGKLFLGITNDGKIGPIDYNLEAVSLTGETSVTPTSVLKDYSAYMAYLKVKYNTSGLFAPKAAFGMGSGDDKSTPNEVEDFQALFLDEGGHNYTNIFADDIHGFRYTDPLSVKYGSGFANVTWFQLGVDAKLLENKLNVEATFTALKATDARTIGSGILGTNTGTTTSDIGTEIDLNFSYKLNEKLGLELRAGHFMPGDIFGDQNNVTKIELFTEFTF
ncbi:MAG: alginate export family protein [Bacteroidetes bacterium]|nr:alginate export family protein [Bacteroidota bacterium]